MTPSSDVIPQKELGQPLPVMPAPPPIVLWWAEERFIPAIFCLDMKTALYLHTFFIAPVGEIGFRICPHCHNQFFQDRPNKDYCCPAHREAHRVARFRNEKKLRAAEAEIKRRSNGTQKAR